MTIGTAKGYAVPAHSFSMSINIYTKSLYVLLILPILVPTGSGNETRYYRDTFFVRRPLPTIRYRSSDEKASILNRQAEV